MRLPQLVLFAAIAASCAPASANDSTAQWGVGGLRFVTSDVSMTRERLFLSKSLVSIDYEFTNDTDTDISTLVAFPLPPVRPEEHDLTIWWLTADQHRDQKNFVEFTVSVDGRPVHSDVQHRATFNGVDITDRLLADGVDIGPLGIGMMEVIREDRRQFYRDMGLDPWADYDRNPLTVSTTYYWQQTFPKKSKTRIEHRYKPVIGQSLQPAAFPENRSLTRDYCLDSAAKGFAARYGKDGGYPFVGYRLDYILKTALNWNGPIADFELVIEKPNPDALLSLCWKGKLEKTSPTTFRFRAKNFVPSEDISLIFIDVPRKAE